jgi:hypothetical protein
MTSFVVDYRNPVQPIETRFTCVCGYYTTYHNGLEWHNANGDIIEPEYTN